MRAGLFNLRRSFVSPRNAFVQTGALNALALFIILGVGSDDMFVIYDHWKAPENAAGTSRLGWVLRKAGFAVFITSATTALSFGTVAITAIQPLYQFGLFSSLLVATNYLLVMSWFPAAMVPLDPWVSKPILFCKRTEALQAWGFHSVLSSALRAYATFVSARRWAAIFSGIVHRESHALHWYAGPVAGLTRYFRGDACFSCPVPQNTP